MGEGSSGLLQSCTNRVLLQVVHKLLLLRTVGSLSVRSLSFISSPGRLDAVVGSASGEDPQLVNIDCTGLGGHDLGFRSLWLKVVCRNV